MHKKVLYHFRILRSYRFQIGQNLNYISTAYVVNDLHYLGQNTKLSDLTQLGTKPKPWYSEYMHQNIGLLWPVSSVKSGFAIQGFMAQKAFSKLCIFFDIRSFSLYYSLVMSQKRDARKPIFTKQIPFIIFALSHTFSLENTKLLCLTKEVFPQSSRNRKKNTQNIWQLLPKKSFLVKSCCSMKWGAFH